MTIFRTLATTARSFQDIECERIVLLVSYGALLGALLSIILIPPASGYELSIYDALPGHTWALLIFAVFLAIGLLIHRAFFTPLDRRKYAIRTTCAFLVLFTVNIIVITLPMIRGYFVGDIGDEYTHIAFIKDIAGSGHIGPTNVYPATHIFTEQITLATSLDPIVTIKYITPLFYVLYLLGMYLLARQLTAHTGKTIFIMTFATAVLLFTYFNFAFLPTHIFVYILPLILYLFFRRGEVMFRYNTLLLAFLFIAPFTHPLGSILLMALFMLFAGAVALTRVLRRSVSPGHDLHYPGEFSLHPTGIILIIFFLWFFQFALSSNTLRKAYEWFFQGQGITPVEIMSVQLKQANFSVLDFLQVVSTTYGHIAIYSFLILAALLIIAYRIITRQHVSVFVMYFSLFYIFLTMFYISTLFTDFIITGRSIRIYCWPLIAGIFIVGMVMYDVIADLRERKMLAAIGIILLLCVAAYIGIFSVFPSPITKQINIQATKMNLYGMDWFFSVKTDDNTFYLDAMPYKSVELIFGRDTVKDERIGHFYLAPMHFGYDSGYCIGDALTEPMYLIISERIRANKMHLWVDRGQIRKDDLIRLADDETNNRIYFNGDVEVIKIITGGAS